MAGTDTKTTNYNLTMPAVGGSGSSWGTKLNSDLVIIDQQMKNNANSIATITGQLGGYSLILNNPAVTYGDYIQSQVAGVSRWVVFLGDGSAETGGDSGSNFAIGRYHDNGTLIGYPFTITRSNGLVYVNNTLAVNTAITTNGTIYSAGTTTSNGTLIANGNATVGGNLNLTGSITSQSGGTIAGGWTVGGPLTANGNLVVQGATYISYNTMGGQYTLSADSNNAYINFAPSWYWNWERSGGKLDWATPGGSGGTLWYPFQIDVAGNVSYAGSLIHISDAAAKENITPFEGDPLAIITEIPVKLYNLLGKPERHIGLIAQDVQAIMPEAVMSTTMTPEGADVFGIDQNRLTAVLWSAVQKLTKRIEELEARVNRL